GVRSLIAAPIPVGGKVQGVLICGQRKEKCYGPRDLELLVIVADRMGLGISRTHIFEDLADQHGKARQVSKFKTQLLQMATHDLKTPLSALSIQLHMMAKSQQTPAKRERSIALMQRSITRLTVMLDDFLELARVEAGRLAIKPVPVQVCKVFGDTLEIFDGKAQERAIQLKVKACPDDLYVSADERRLAQVTANLLSNAIRYSPKDTTVTMGANTMPDYVEIYVQDQGLGLTKEQHARLFKPFSQVHGVPEESQGTGLGLYLSQAIVEAHGGRLSLQSDGKGKGTRAAFTLPRVESPDA
ncbi:MAG TPA: GAF domain-containing sensor histidine kinase, partial [Candidatus Thermoplasmatota archaeon]|nr:GAF domain-containing sensor histidine kinase [Candidatus Thermoplasmatota archaeon]